MSYLIYCIEKIANVKLKNIPHSISNWQGEKSTDQIKLITFAKICLFDKILQIQKSNKKDKTNSLKCFLQILILSRS